MMSTSQARITAKQWLMLLLIPLIGLCLALIPTGPMLGMKAHDLPVAIVNNDASATLPTGQKVNAGAQMAKQLSSAKQDLMDLRLTRVGCFLALISLTLQYITADAVNLLDKKGIVIPVLILLFGMTSMALPHEFLPGFWRDWIYPWIPTHFAGEGLRSILFGGPSAWGSPAGGLLCAAVAGLILTIIAIYLPRRAERARA